MPIARNPAQHNYHWIPREAETEFQNLLKDGKAYVLPLVGVGGAGKTSLLRRFFSYCERNEIPALYIDLPKLTIASTLDMLLRVESVHTPTFNKLRKKLGTGHETSAAVLQGYAGHAKDVVELAKKGMDSSKGTILDAVVGTVKLLHTALHREEARNQQALQQEPEVHLLRALAEDFQRHGVILIDTLEQAGKQNLQTQLRFDGIVDKLTTDSLRPCSLIDYCAGIANFLFDKPVIMVLAGRPPAIRELGTLPLDYFAPTVDVPAFTADEIRTYLESNLPRHLAPPQDSDISKLQQLTLGNPFLVERVVRLLADWQPTWEWKAEQWQPLLNSFLQDERHGLLLYVTQRLLTHVLPDDRAFWRLALPRQYIHRDMAELLFPKDEFGEQSGLQRLKTYEEKGTVYREQDPDRYFLHDETRAGLTAWATREKVWLDKAALEIHARLAAWFDQQSGWPDEYPDTKGKTHQYSNPLLLEGSYHKLMADHEFELRHSSFACSRQEFWTLLSSTISWNNSFKRRFIALLPELPLWKTQAFFDILKIDSQGFNKLFRPDAQKWLVEKNSNGILPDNWFNNEAFLHEAINKFPNEACFLGELAYIKENSYKNFDEAEKLYLLATQANPTHAPYLGNFAIFLHRHRKDYIQAKELYNRVLKIESDIPNHKANLAQLYLFEGDKIQGRTLIDQAFASDFETSSQAAIKLELWFYRLAHFPQDYPQAQAEIMALLETGARSEGWDFSGNIAQAEKDGHQNIALLRTLADTISGRTSETQASIL